MAIRPIFVAGTYSSRIWEIRYADFQYFNGFSDVQKKKCIKSLHDAFLEHYPQQKLLEISSHSPEELGVRLSAFNLPVQLQSGKEVSVECAFQASKIFEHGGPYLDLLEGTSKAAKKDPRLKNSGGVTGFYFEGETFDIYPKTCFYHWLYIRALHVKPELADALMAYDSFTDIVFNPAKSLNCQAESAAIYVGLRSRNLLEEVLKSKEDFIRVVYHTGTGKR